MVFLNNKFKPKLSVIATLCCLSSYAMAENRHINLTLLDNSAVLKKQSAMGLQNPVSLNRKSTKAVTASKAELTSQDVVIVGLDNKGNELSRQVIKNPLYFRAEVFDQHSGTMAFSKDIKRNSAVLNLVLPDDQKLGTHQTGVTN